MSVGPLPPLAAMSKTDRAIVALTAFALGFAVVGVMDPGTWGNIPLLWAIVALAASAGWTIRRGSTGPRRPQGGATAAPDADLDARQVLEIDERLAVLERRDTQHVRKLAAWDAASGPAPALAGVLEPPLVWRDRPEGGRPDWEAVEGGHPLPPFRHAPLPLPDRE